MNVFRLSIAFCLTRNSSVSSSNPNRNNSSTIEIIESSDTPSRSVPRTKETNIITIPTMPSERGNGDQIPVADLVQGSLRRLRRRALEDYHNVGEDGKDNNGVTSGDNLLESTVELGDTDSPDISSNPADVEVGDQGPEIGENDLKQPTGTELDVGDNTKKACIDIAASESTPERGDLGYLINLQKKIRDAQKGDSSVITCGHSLDLNMDLGDTSTPGISSNAADVEVGDQGPEIKDQIPESTPERGDLGYLNNLQKKLRDAQK